ncbi:unnamed protein product [Candida verbasci]|uniref:Major facilitator superfamily (MFS) profile domain-containing protein n=1 Tax=Candida verbasci TaxID=1227364 RepID=A0A9W4TWG6_9ASCO|nr:unnamed protein product [Candida verbasci]
MNSGTISTAETLNIDNFQDAISKNNFDPHDERLQLARSQSRRLSNTESLFKQASRQGIPSMGHNKEMPPPILHRSNYEVSYDLNDPLHPYNWSFPIKAYILFVCLITSFGVAMGSALFASSQPSLMIEFNISWTVSALVTSLFVLGFASGPIVWGPLSEFYGRKIPFVVSNLGFVCFSFGVATAKDIQTIMLCRFFAGFIGASNIVLVPSIMTDIFRNENKNKALGVFAMAIFGAPMISPILGGFTVKNDDLGWRWTGYFIAIVGSFGLVLALFVPETLADVILIQKAEKLRRATGNWAIHAPQESIKLSIKEIVKTQITKPLRMLTDPILFFISLYNSFVYCLLYMFLTVIPLIFGETYGWSRGVSELPYISMFIGTFIGGIIVSLLEKRNQRITERNGGTLVPENHLISMMIGSFFFAGGMFWLGWSGGFGDDVLWLVPTLALCPVGIGLIAIFLPCLTYITDCYLFVSASALSANTLLRSSMAAAAPLFSRQMFENLEIKWACTLLGAIACALIPVPFLFYIYGDYLRSKSKYCISFEAPMHEKENQHEV